MFDSILNTLPKSEIQQFLKVVLKYVGLESAKEISQSSIFVELINKRCWRVTKGAAKPFIQECSITCLLLKTVKIRGKQRSQMNYIRKTDMNPFHTAGLFLYPLKTKKFLVFGYFQEVRKWPVAINRIIMNVLGLQKMNLTYKSSFAGDFPKFL